MAAQKFELKPHKFQMQISHTLYKKLKAEHSFNHPPTVSYGVIGKLIEIFEKRLLNVELNYKGKK
jgi:hypothetical protein